MNNKHYDNLVTIAKFNGIYSCAMDLVDEMRCLAGLICDNDCDAKPMKNILIKAIACIYNLLDQFCIVFDIEDMVQDKSEEIAENEVKAMMESAE